MKMVIASRPDWPASLDVAKKTAVRLRLHGHEIVELPLDGRAATHIAVRADAERLIVYWADGLIVATATGSTAYGFSVGGPLILPVSRSITMVPIAPHLSFGNAVVFDPEQELELEVQDEPAILSLDGQEEHELKKGDKITVRRAESVARFARTAHTRPFV